ncbi:MAG: pyridoxal-phosphate dependent enzyme [Planctomycetota bacterium]|nr:pyridoxal-phosphate dependent enzyme [Planctomycetota bacterium]
MSVTLDDVRAAAARLEGVVHETPVLTSSYYDDRLGMRCFFKCENLQKVGAFKFRGASNAVLQLSEEDAANGVVTHSSGNHAQALALAAEQRGIPAWIVMPTDAPSVKRAAVKGYGATVVPCAPTLASREATAERVMHETGATFIHPYDDDRIIAGAGTAALELMETVIGLDAVITPVGGGGLLSGTCIAVHGLDPEVMVLAAEPELADDAARSLEAGELIPAGPTTTIADGLKTSLSARTFAILQQHVHEIVTVTEDAIREHMRTVWERMKIIIEPSCATVLAALEKRRSAYAGSSVGVIISGGNVDLDNLPW